MNALTVQMREIARNLLTEGRVDMVLGWEKGSRWYLSPPAFVKREDAVERLICDEFAVNDLSVYLLDWRDSKEKVALFVKGCDSRGVVRLLQDNQIERDRVVIIGVPCVGKLDKAAVTDEFSPHELPLLAKCRECTHPNPVLADHVIDQIEVPQAVSRPIGSAMEETTASTMGSEADGRFEPVKKIMALSANERRNFWRSHIEQCLRCYACRNVCPACNCRECVFESDKLGRSSKFATVENNTSYLITRSLHVAGRCSECGECARVCPAGLPLMLLNRLVVQDINTRFGDYEAGIDFQSTSPLGLFKPDDQHSAG